MECSKARLIGGREFGPIPLRASSICGRDLPFTRRGHSRAWCRDIQPANIFLCSLESSSTLQGARFRLVHTRRWIVRRGQNVITAQHLIGLPRTWPGSVSRQGGFGRTPTLAIGSCFLPLTGAVFRTHQMHALIDQCSRAGATVGATRQAAASGARSVRARLPSQEAGGPPR